MVRILSNGDIVPDDDPSPAQPSTSRGQEATENRQQRRGFVQNEAEPVRHMPQADASIFDTMNERLLDVGIPRWNLGPYVMEPIVTVALLLALILIGFKGLILGLVLFFVCKWSSTGGTQDNQGFRGWRGGNVGGTGAGQQGARGGGGAMGMMGRMTGMMGGGQGGGQGGAAAGRGPQSQDRGNNRGWSGGSGHRLGRS